jgi:hypothetical protein
MDECNWNPGPDWERIPGGWRHREGTRMSDWFPRQSNDALFSPSAMGEFSVAIQEVGSPDPRATPTSEEKPAPNLRAFKESGPPRFIRFIMRSFT